MGGGGGGGGGGCVLRAEEYNIDGLFFFNYYSLFILFGRWVGKACSFFFFLGGQEGKGVGISSRAGQSREQSVRIYILPFCCLVCRQSLKVGTRRSIQLR